MALTCGTSTWLEAINLINDNETNIATNTTDIADLQTRVTALEQQHDAGWAKVSAINDIPETWTEVITLNMDDVKPGIYMLSASVLYTYSSTTSSAEIRFTVNGVQHIFTREPKDSTNTETGSLILPVDMSSGGDINVLVEAQKESGGPTFNIIEANLICLKFL
jgi:hypothetical protein